MAEKENDFNYCDKEGNHFLPKCTKQCSSCAKVDMAGHIMESNSARQVLKEIHLLYEMKIDLVNECYKLLAFDPVKVKEIFDELDQINEKIQKLKDEF